MGDIPRRRGRHRGSWTSSDSSTAAADSSSGSGSEIEGSNSLEDSDSREEEEDLSPDYPQEDSKGDPNAYGHHSP